MIKDGLFDSLNKDNNDYHMRDFSMTVEIFNKVLELVDCFSDKFNVPKLQEFTGENLKLQLNNSSRHSIGFLFGFINDQLM